MHVDHLDVLAGADMLAAASAAKLHFTLLSLHLLSLLLFHSHPPLHDSLHLILEHLREGKKNITESGLMSAAPVCAYVYARVYELTY